MLYIYIFKQDLVEHKIVNKHLDCLKDLPNLHNLNIISPNKYPKNIKIVTNVYNYKYLIINNMNYFIMYVCKYIN